MKKALITGSFDPVTLGHVDLVERACALFDEVHFVAFINPEKNYTFTKEKRIELMKIATSHLPGVVCGYDEGMVYEYVLKNSIDCIVKGARCGADFEYEAKMAEFNREKSGVDTLILPSDPRYADFSSTRVREMLAKGEAIENLVGKKVAQAIKEAKYNTIK